MRRNLLREPFTDIENRHGLSTHLTWGSVISPHSVGRRSSADTHTDPPHDHIELQQSLRATLHLVVRTRAPGLYGPSAPKPNIVAVLMAHGSIVTGTPVITPATGGDSWSTGTGCSPAGTFVPR